ncbi:hypothetical protein T492DRAFT_1016004 [Pavlovales sp. CCMP2436]|nr:hypothetical protein T492DRAFT_1016004 [Pavlovales sp. CCMP2436]
MALVRLPMATVFAATSPEVAIPNCFRTAALTSGLAAAAVPRKRLTVEIAAAAVDQMLNVDEEQRNLSPRLSARGEHRRLPRMPAERTHRPGQACMQACMPRG